MTGGSGRVGLEVTGGVARITLDRPEARNAMSFAMYDELAGHCEALAGRSDLYAVLIRGEGAAFAAGTDIAEFERITSGEAGLAYETRVERVILGVEHLRVPTIALVDGPAMGGGLIIAAACDFRLATSRSRFGAPVARTLGNMLSARNVARLEREFGIARVRRMLLLSDTISATEAQQCGFVIAIAEPATLISEGESLAERLSLLAPGTIGATRELVHRMLGGNQTDSDLLAAVYGGPDFAEGVRAFLERRKPNWAQSGSGPGRQ